MRQHPAARIRSLASLCLECPNLREGFSYQSLFATVQSLIGSGRQILKLRVPMSSNDATAVPSATARSNTPTCLNRRDTLRHRAAAKRNAEPLWLWSSC